jgi:hypothetical protein
LVTRKKDLPLEKVATANLEVGVSAVMIGGNPERVDMDIVSLALQSSGGPSSPVLIKFAKHLAGRDEVLISIPLFETLLYLVDWDIFIPT